MSENWTRTVVEKSASLQLKVIPLFLPIHVSCSYALYYYVRACCTPGIYLGYFAHSTFGCSPSLTSTLQDSSATMVLPRINVVKHGSDGLRHVFLLKVSNPTLGVIRIRMQPSSYKGEPVIHGDNEDMTSLFDNLIVDSLEQTRIRAKLVTDLTDNLGATQVCELEAAEDSFLELGKSARNDPLQVVNWSATDVLSKSEVSTSSASSTLKFLDRSLSDGWFELAVLETASEVAPFVAIPLSLEIEVGNGSWESSLVQQQLAHGGDKDTARFDFVVTFVSSIRNNSNTD
jgi:hypothetical protein